jgi:hypothetical protein
MMGQETHCDFESAAASGTFQALLAPLDCLSAMTKDYNATQKKRTTTYWQAPAA